MTQTEPDSPLCGWMERYLDGDKRAFAMLYETLRPRLRAFIARLVRDESAVEDLLQLAFLKAHLARDSFEIRQVSPSNAVQAWYFTIARNVTMDELRKRGRGAQKLTASTENEWISNAEDPTLNVEQAQVAREVQSEIMHAVRAAVESLPESQREVIELHKLRGMSMTEIAKRLRLREGAVRVRAHRGYKALAKLLTRQGATLIGWLSVIHLTILERILGGLC